MKKATHITPLIVLLGLIFTGLIVMHISAVQAEGIENKTK